MDWLLFPHTIDNRFAFHLFEFLLSGVILLVVFRARRRAPDLEPLAHCLLPAISLLNLSLAYLVLWAGLRFLLAVDPGEAALSSASHLALAGVWLLVLFCFGPGRHPRLAWGVGGAVALVSVMVVLVPALGMQGARFNRVLDLWVVLVVAVALAPFLRHSGGHPVLKLGMAALVLARLFHLAVPEASPFPYSPAQLLCWNVEQFLLLGALLLLTLAVGESTRNLFDRAFVRIQVVFILLAGLIILIVTRVEQTQYVEQARDRSANLGLFVSRMVESALTRGSLTQVLQREDLMTRIVTDFGNFPELAAVEIMTSRDSALIEIEPSGEISRWLSPLPPDRVRRLQDPDRYFLVGSFALREPGGSGAVRLYGLKSYMDGFTRRRTVLIFILFTGAVGLATLMVGLVVRRAERTLQLQEQELRSSQEDLAMASKLATLGEMAGSVAHEVNNPATTILSRASFLLKRWRRRQGPADEEEDLKTIVEQAQRIAQITASLLGFSRKYVLELTPVQLCDVLEKSLGLVREDLEAGGIEVELKGCPCPRVARGDRNSLVQVFVNLLRNAIDSMPKGGRIDIEVVSHDGPPPRVEILLSDTGKGIAREDLDRIFLPFYTGKRMGRGTGLGLAVVHGIIAEHKGTIRVESEPGQGATFDIELPAAVNHV